MLLFLCVAAQLQDQDDGVRPGTGGEDTSADFPVGGVQALLGVKEAWGVNNKKLSPLPFPGCFLTSFGNSLGSNPRVEYFPPRIVFAVALFPHPVFPTNTILRALLGVVAMFTSRVSAVLRLHFKKRKERGKESIEVSRNHSQVFF